MNRFVKMSLAVVLVGLTLTTQAQVSAEFDKNVDFSKYKTFAWRSPKLQKGGNPIYSSDLVEANIHRHVTEALGKRGIAEVNRQPDLLVQVQTYTEAKTRTTGDPYAWGWNGFHPFSGFWGWRGFYPMGAWGPSFNQYQFTEGTLVVDLIDARTRQLVWRGVAQGAVDNHKRLERNIAKGVHKMMKKLPVDEV